MDKTDVQDPDMYEGVQDMTPTINQLVDLYYGLNMRFLDKSVSIPIVDGSPRIVVE